MSPYPLRPATFDEFLTFHEVLLNAFNEAPDEESWQRERDLLEFDRTLVALDGDQMVASAAAYSFDLTVPGGSVPAAGVTWVSVLPTHRRRGLLRTLMRRQLDDIHAAGREPIATLWASEAGIYGRFGYGLAAAELSLTVPRDANALRAAASTAGLRTRLVDPAESIELVLPLYDHDRARRPGMFALSPSWQQMRIFTPAAQRSGSGPLRCVVVEDDGGVRAYARYSVASAWLPTGADSTVTVRDVHAADPAGLAAVWTFLLDLDLTARVVARRRPVDDPLLRLLNDPRGTAAALSDGLYVRIVDVAAALSARTYGLPVDVVLEVEDDFCPWNSGRWHLAGDATGARCEPTTAAPQVTLGARELGAVYLGGTSLAALADAGLVGEHSPGAVKALSAALRHEPAPWCPIVF